MGDPSTPLWVVNVRDEIGRSPAWEVLSDQLYERVSIVLRSHGLGHFSDLSSAEQITLLEEAHREIVSENNEVYQAFESQFSKSMDAEIAKEARVRVDQDEGAKRNGADEALYLDRILEAAAEGAVALLRELPREHLGSLRLMLNQPIPSRARLEIWKLLLRHTSAREDYELLMKQNRNSTISGQDIYITHRCQALLESGRVATCRLLPLTSRNVVLMKTVLSHHHACKMSKRGQKATMDVPEAYVHFLVPLCAVITRGEQFSSSASTGAAAAAAAAAGAPPREQKIELMIEDLVEMFESGLEAGLKGLVDPKELAGPGGGGGGGSESVLPRGKKSGSTRPTARGARAGRGVVESAEDGGDKAPPPAWVEVAHASLAPGYQGLVDHVTRAHLGLPVAVAEDAAEGAEDGDGGGGGGSDGGGVDASRSSVTEGSASKAEASPPKDEKPQAAEAAAGEDKQQTQDKTADGDDDAPPGGRRESSTRRASSQKAHTSAAEAGTADAANPEQTGGGNASDGSSNNRRRSSTRREELKARRASSSSADAGAGSAAGPENTGGGDKAGDAPPTRRRSSSLKDVTEEKNNEKEEEEDEEGNTAATATKSLSEDVARKTVALAEVDPSQTRAALWALLKPMVTVGLVGHLGAEACLFAWDQAVVGGFGVMLPRVAAMVVAAARQKLEACATFAVMCEALLSHAQLLSTSQLQELMEGHCMPAIREEMRVSEKLSPTIIGPTLKTATEILDSAYSKQTREAQEARKAHVEHVLGSSGGPERDGKSKLLRLGLSPSRAQKHRKGVGEGGGEGEAEGGGEEEGGLGGGGRRVEGKGGGGGRGGDAEGSDERSAGVKPTRRSLPSHRGTSDSDDAEGGKRSRRAGNTGDADAPNGGGNTGKGKGTLEPAKRDAGRRRTSQDRKPPRRGEINAAGEGSGGAAAPARSRRRSSDSTNDDYSGAVGDSKRKGGKRLQNTSNETARVETVKNGNNDGGNGRRSQPTKTAGNNNNNNNNNNDGRKGGGRRPSSGLSTPRGGSSSLTSSSSLGTSRENSSRKSEEEPSQSRSSTGQKGRRKRRQSFEEEEKYRGGRSAGGKAAPRTRNQGARKSAVAIVVDDDDDDDDITSDDIATPDGGSTPGEKSGKSGTSRAGGGGGDGGRRTSKGRETNSKRRQKISEADEVKEAQMEVYKRVYTDEQIDALPDAEREAFDRKQPKFDKALRSLRAAREAGERRGEDAPPTNNASSKTKQSSKKEGLKGAGAGDGDEAKALLPPKKEKPAPHVWEEEGESEFSPIPASSLAAPRSPLKRWLGIGGWNKASNR